MFEYSDLVPGKIILLTGDSGLVQNVLYPMIAEVALVESVTLLVANNWLDIYRLNYQIAIRGDDYAQTLKQNIHLKRGETIYQVYSALNQFKITAGVFFVMGLLANFHDESLDEHEVDQLFVSALVELHRIKYQVPIVIIDQPDKHRARLWLALAAAVDQTIHFHLPVELDQQPRLKGM